MNLLETQRAFSAQLLNHDEAFVAAEPGIEVYRNAYRARLVEALRIGFDRTWAWVGDEAFAAAAAHHVIDTPPSSWTLDDYGSSFADTLTTLFADAAEVGELAWLEWHMQRAFAVEDTAVLDATAFAALCTDDQDWDELCFALVPSFANRRVATNATAIWRALGHDDAPLASCALAAAAELIVWRQGFSPHFRLLDADESAALSLLAAGHSFGALCASVTATSDGDAVGMQDAAALQIGTWLGQWIRDGLITDGVRRATTTDSAQPSGRDPQ